MKKRLRGLLALTLALCMGLTMTVSAVSAADYYFEDVNSDGNWKLYDSNSVVVDLSTTVFYENDKIYAGSSSGGALIEVDSNGVIKYNDNSNVPNQEGAPTAEVTDANGDTLYWKEDQQNPSNNIAYKAYLGGKQFFSVPATSKITVRSTWDYQQNTNSVLTIYLEPYTPPAPAPSLPPISYKIKYVAEDGAESGTYSESFTAGTTGSAGAIASAEELGFTKEGFKAKPQWLLPDGTVVETGAAIKDVFSQLEDNAVDTGYRQREIVLTAQWEDIRYTVKYDANGGTGIMEDQIFTVDQEGVLTKNAFVYEGYDFNGWNTAADGAGTAYADEATVMNLAKGGETITLYAQWTELPETPVAGPDGSEEDPADDPSGKDEDAAGRDDGSGKTDGEQAYDHSAATGDDTNVLLWTFLAMLAMLTAGTLTGTRKKES